MENFSRIEAAYKAMDKQSKQAAVAILEAWAKARPEKNQVSLRIVHSKPR